MTNPIVIVGAGGHSRVLLDLITLLGFNVVSFAEVSHALIGTKIDEIPVLEQSEAFHRFKPGEALLVNGVGSPLATRANLYLQLRKLGYAFATLIHPSASVSSKATILHGAQIMAGSIIQAGVVIGENTIINSGAIVDHDCKIAAHVHVAPGAVICGGVSVGQFTHIGAGASVIENTVVGSSSLIGAGAAIIKDVESGHRVFGVPGIVRTE